jgi:hypothetical protein
LIEEVAAMSMPNFLYHQQKDGCRLATMPYRNQELVIASGPRETTPLLFYGPKGRQGKVVIMTTSKEASSYPRSCD